jgi:hypothetical protein
MSLQLSGDIGVTYTDGSNQPSASSPYVLKNRLVNGSFAIDQRNAGASQTFTAAAAIAYTVDRWYGSCTGANITGQRVAGTSPNQYAYRFTGAASNTATLFGQRIESFNTYDLISTTVTGSVTLKSSSITSVTWTAYYANSSDTFSSKTSIATGTLTINSTATRYSFSFDAGANAGNGIAIEFTTGALTATNTLQYENAQIEVGSTATPFERRLYNQELANCQRYFYVIRNNIAGVQYNVITLGAFNTTRSFGAFVTPVPLRANPTFTFNSVALRTPDTNTTANVTDIYPVQAVTVVPLPSYIPVEINVASGLTSNVYYGLAFQASTNDFVALSAEL